MKQSQHALFDTVTGFVASHGQVAIALGGLFVAAVAFGVGWGYRDGMSTWLATSVRVGGLLSGVIVLALQASRGGWLTGVDHSVTAWLVAHRNPVIDDVALAVSTALGPVELAVLTTAGAVTVGIASRSAVCGLTVLATVGCASALCSLIKLLVGRPRPPLAIQETLETDYSFPSGHVTGTAALVGILAVAAAPSASRMVKRLLVAVAVLAVSAVALSRLYLGVHWLTDVAAGVLLAAAVVTAGATGLAAPATTRRGNLPSPSCRAPPKGQCNELASSRIHAVAAHGVKTPRNSAPLALVVLATVGLLTGCSPTTGHPAGPPTAAVTSKTVAPEHNPVGDIPDTQVYVAYRPPSQLFTVSVTEGWAQIDDGSATTFTDKLNAVRIEIKPFLDTLTPDVVQQEKLPPSTRRAPDTTSVPSQWFNASPGPSSWPPTKSPRRPTRSPESAASTPWNATHSGGTATKWC